MRKPIIFYLDGFSETLILVIFGQILPMKPSIFSKWFQDLPKKNKKKFLKPRQVPKKKKKIVKPLKSTTNLEGIKIRY